MQTSGPLVRDLVLVGGGHTHALLLLGWGMRPLPGVRLTLIDPAPAAAYSGMLPGYVAGHYRLEELQIDLVRLARFAGARLIPGAAAGLDPERRLVQVPGRAPIAFDLASVDIGITARMPDLPGFARHAVPAKPLGAFAARWQDFVAEAKAAARPLRVAVIGGGVAGVELALTMQHRLTSEAGGGAVTVIERDTALTGVTPGTRRRLLTRLAAAGIALIEGAEIAEVTGAGPVLGDGTRIAADLTVGAARATPAPWLAETGMATEAGYLAVGPDLQSTSHPGIFAAGDCAHLSAHPRPKAGVFAVRAAPILDRNLRAVLAGRPTRGWRPQRSYLKLISLGPREAIAQKGPLVVQGRLMWRWKDRIDRRFMAMLQELPGMPPPALPAGAPPEMAAEAGGQPFCGGCGAKVGAGALARALAALPAQRAPELESQPGDDAAVLEAAGRWQVISTDHLRAVVEDPYLMTRIALVHAMGDVWAMGAVPQLALAQVVIPRMSAALQARTLAEITAAAAEGCAELGAALAGGHSTMGAEMTLGFTVTGLAGRPPLRKGGAQPGDVLLLTRPLGSGTLLAAEMRRAARGPWIAALLAQMVRPQGAEAAILAEHAHAMTDVTGFGLAGHLLEMANASGAGMELTLADLPFYEGAREMAAAGVRSTIWQDNRAACLPWMTGVGESAAAALLFDPQTCGGLLAALPPGPAMEAVARIAAAGGAARVIGRVLSAEPGIAVV